MGWKLKSGNDKSHYNVINLSTSFNFSMIFYIVVAKLISLLMVSVKMWDLIPLRMYFLMAKYNSVQNANCMSKKLNLIDIITDLAGNWISMGMSTVCVQNWIQIGSKNYTWVTASLMENANPLKSISRLDAQFILFDGISCLVAKLTPA